MKGRAYRCESEKSKYPAEHIIQSARQLDADCRDMVLMRLAERRTWLQIGNAIHRSPTTARRYYRQAVKLLERFHDWNNAMGKQLMKKRVK